MEDDQQFCLRWNNHQSTLISVFDTLLENETLVDCTIAAEGRFLKAHKVVLSACSPYFATLLQEQYDKHPIFILKDVKFQELRAMMDYMYRGEVNISQDQLAALLKAAESLQIKGLSDNRGTAPRQEQQQQPRANIATGKNSYTLETKRPRIGPGPLEPQDVSGSREGSSSPSRRRRKARRRSIENDVHDNSNSSVTPQTQPSNANLAGVSAMTAAALASQMTAAGASVVSAPGIAVVGGQQAGTTQLTTNVPKKTETIKGTSDAMNTETLQTTGSITGTTIAPATTIDEQDTEHIATTALKEQKSNHKQQKSKDNASTISPGDMTIEPKSEYDEEANEESVEDLTLDDEMGMEDLDHNAGTSQGGEGSSQEYAWQHDRSQDGLLLTTQEAQQRDPQVKYENNYSTIDNKSNLILNLKKEGYHYEEGLGVGGGCEDGGMIKLESSSGGMEKLESSLGGGQRFFCSVCGKSYLRKRHLQRHMRDECIGIPPRFSCDLCPSRFRRKYHMVRHLTSKHGIPPNVAQQTTGSRSGGISGFGGNSNGTTNGLALNGLINNMNSVVGSGGGEATSSNNGGSTNGSVHGGNDSGCDSPLPENLTVRKENYEHDLMKRFSPIDRANNAKGTLEAINAPTANGQVSPPPPPPAHFHCPIPTYGLTGAITAISAAAAVVEEQAAAAAAAAAGSMALANQENNDDLLKRNASPIAFHASLPEGAGGGGVGVGVGPSVENIITAGIKTEPITPGKAINMMDDEWKMKLSLQLISNSLLKERLMNTMPYAYNNN